MSTDKKTRHRLISSGAFSNSSDGSGMSVYLGDTLAQQSRAPESTVAGTSYLLVRLSAGCVRTITDPQQDVVRSPIEDEPAHGDVIGEKTGSVRRRLAVQAIWAVAPAGTSPGRRAREPFPQPSWGTSGRVDS